MAGLKCIAAGGERLSIVSRSSLIGIAVIAALSAQKAKGALSLTLSEAGYAPITQTAASGTAVSFIGAYGDFTTNIVIGSSNSQTPSSTGELQVQSLDVTKNSTSAAETLTITLSDGGYTFPGSVGASLLLTSSLGGTLTSSRVGDSVTFQSTATPSTGSPVTTGVQSYVSPIAPPGSISFMIPPASNTFTQTGSYSLTSQIVASLSDPNETANLSGTTTVSVNPTPIPEPVGISCLGVAGLGLLARRRRILA